MQTMIIFGVFEQIWRILKDFKHDINLDGFKEGC